MQLCLEQRMHGVCIIKGEMQKPKVRANDTRVDVKPCIQSVDVQKPLDWGRRVVVAECARGEFSVAG